MEKQKEIILNISMYVHFLCEIFTCFYAFIFKSKYDIFFLSYFFVILVLKLCFKYECIWSVYDKKIMNPTYVLGSEPNNCPFRKIYGNSKIVYIIGLLILIELIIIFLRNKNIFIKYFTVINLLLILYIEFKISKNK